MLGQMDKDIPHYDPHTHSTKPKHSHKHKKSSADSKSGNSKGKSVRHLGAEVVENAMKNKDS